jgi:hypothetical protein
MKNADKQGKNSEAHDGRTRRLANLEAHKFKPGQSGNPKGRPKSITLSEAYRKMLAQVDEADAQKPHNLPEYLQPAVVMAQLGQPQFVEIKLEQEAHLRQMKMEDERKEKEAAMAWKRFQGGPIRRRRYSG